MTPIDEGAPRVTESSSAASTQRPSADADAPSEPATTRGRHAAEPSMGQLVSDASTALSTLLRSEIELAKLELRATVKNAGTGGGFFAAAAVILVFSLTFGFFALAEGLATIGIWRWAAFLIVFGFQLLLVGFFVLFGIRKVKRVRAPQQTIRTSKETVDYLKKSRGS